MFRLSYRCLSNKLTVEQSFEVLGIPFGSAKAEIKKAFLKKAKLYHPDLNPHDPSAKQQFIIVQEAYLVLKDTTTFFRAPVAQTEKPYEYEEERQKEKEQANMYKDVPLWEKTRWRQREEYQWPKDSDPLSRTKNKSGIGWKYRNIDGSYKLNGAWMDIVPLSFVIEIEADDLGHEIKSYVRVSDSPVPLAFIVPSSGSKQTTLLGYYGDLIVTARVVQDFVTTDLDNIEKQIENKKIVVLYDDVDKEVGRIEIEKNGNIVVRDVRKNILVTASINKGTFETIIEWENIVDNKKIGKSERGYYFRADKVWQVSLHKEGVISPVATLFATYYIHHMIPVDDTLEHK